MSVGSITRGIPKVSPASKAFLQLPLTSCGERELKSLQNQSLLQNVSEMNQSYIRSGLKL